VTGAPSGLSIAPPKETKKLNKSMSKPTDIPQNINQYSHLGGNEYRDGTFKQAICVYFSVSLDIRNLPNTVFYIESKYKLNTYYGQCSDGSG
jgi:hypothetical protein